MHAPAVSLVKRRFARRRAQEGAAMFIVAMTLAVLASVGIYALAAASNEVRTAGNERQNTQTHYLAEYGVIGATHEMVSSKAQFYLGLMLATPDGLPPNPPCTSLPNFNPATAAPVTRACRRLGSTELGQPWTGTTVTVPYGGTVPYQQGVPPGSFGPVPLQGDFYVELTDPQKASDAKRYAKDDFHTNFCFMRITATSTGITRPIVTQIEGMYSNEGLEVQRARIIAGPVQCPR